MTGLNRACPAEMQADGSNRRWVWILLAVVILGAGAREPTATAYLAGVAAEALQIRQQPLGYFQRAIAVQLHNRDHEAPVARARRSLVRP